MNAYQVAFLLGTCATLLVVCFISDMALQGPGVSIKMRATEAWGNAKTATKAAVLGCLIVAGALAFMWGFYETLHYLGDMK